MLTGTLRAALLLALSLLVACKTGASTNGEHWVVDSVPARMVKHFTGFRTDTAGRYVDYQYQKKKHINLTLRRHFLLNSPDDPFEASDPSQTNRRRAHSPAPDPLYYFHAESMFIGAALLGITGAFIPVPVDSVIASFLPGGGSEFVRGFTGGGSAKTPPTVGNFRVKNR